MDVREDQIVEVGPESRDTQDSSRDSVNGSRQAPYAWITSKESLVPLAFTNPMTDLGWRTPVGGLHVYVPVVGEARFPEVGGEEPPEGSSTGLLVYEEL